MCVAGLPAIAGVVSAVTSVAGTALSVIGQRNAAAAESAAATYQAKQSRILAEDALKRGAAEEQAVRRRTSALEGRQRAVMAASNLDLGSGSPLDILTDTAVLGELDAQTTRGNAQREATQLRSQANLFDMKASAATSAGNIGAIGTAIGGISSLADRWYKPLAKRV